MNERTQHLCEISADFSVNGEAFPLTLDVFGFQRDGRHIIARVMLEVHDITLALPDRAVSTIAALLDQEVPLANTNTYREPVEVGCRTCGAKHCRGHDARDRRADLGSEVGR